MYSNTKKKKKKMHLNIKIRKIASKFKKKKNVFLSAST